MEKINRFSQQVCDFVIGMSTLDWKKIVVKILKDDYVTSTGVYYKVDEKYYFILDLVDTDVIDEDVYDEVSDNIYDILIALKDEYEQAGEKMWTNLLLIINEDKQYEVKVDYDELPEDSFNEEVRWRYKYLGIDPGEGFQNVISDIKQEIL